jgi:hypothetical protein
LPLFWICFLHYRCLAALWSWYSFQTAGEEACLNYASLSSLSLMSLLLAVSRFVWCFYRDLLTLN